jgi:hypothetical protein
MIRILIAVALACASAIAHAEPSANFLAGIRSINVVMHRDRVAWSKRYIVFAVHYDGNVWYDKPDAIALPRAECERYAKASAGGARCYSARELRALRSSPPTVAELRQRK